MAYDFQVTADSADPHALADWWAATLGWDVEPSNEAFIREMVDNGYAKDEDTKVHHGVLVWREGAAIVHPGSGRRVLFQLVPEAVAPEALVTGAPRKTVKNRVHLDIRVGADQVEAELAKLTERGATFLHRGRQGPQRWVTLQDPEGNEFCIS